MDADIIKLIRLAGECGELIQQINKALQFGIDSINPDTGISTRDSLKAEAADVMTCIDQLQIDHVEMDVLKRKKAIRIARNAEYEIPYEMVCND